MPIVGASAGEGHSVRNLVESRGRDLRRLKIDAGAGIAERRASSWLGGVVIIEAERGLATMLAVYVAATPSLVGGSCTLAFRGDAGSCRFFPCEVRDGRTGMIIREGDAE